MFYEAKHSLDTEYCQVEVGRDFSYPLHVHSCFEIIVVTDGEMEVSVGSHSKTLKKGEAAIIFPNCIHGMKTYGKSEHKLCIFSKKLINHYSKKTQTLIPENPFFTLDEAALILFSRLSGDSSVCERKSVLYFLAGLFDKNALYVSAETDTPSSLLYEILEYIEETYASDCSLKNLSKRVKYDYAYLSKYFIKNIKMPFNEYVNRRKISEVCYLLSTTEESILNISAESGFGSLRSLNRNFREIMGITPAEYRRKSSER